MSRYLCIHGHFYQPPRENPWLETVELQDSAYPFHDWNARITAECYGPNATSRILEPGGRISGIMNNYSRISFNMGPTLLSWMEQAEPTIYEAIIEGDRLSREIYSGHGSAIAQSFNHIILPLANSRDKRTQIIWGIEDFRLRFGREPEGMWLAETAVDIESMEIMAEHGIIFTILAPRQASRVREIDEDEWHDVSEGRVDPRRPYLCQLPSGRTMNLFFYDGPIAQDLAFGGLLNNGEAMANRLVRAFDKDDKEPQLVHVAADGETFGHHHRQGEMALSYCLHHIEANEQAQLTIYAEYLEKFPPTWEADIFENSSWSCVHGVERWRSNCGCNSGMHGGWQQEWRKPLRDALDWLRDHLLEYFEKEARPLLKEPWATRDRFVEVILRRTPEMLHQFLDREAKKTLDPTERQRATKLLEIQRQSMLMYTSCGWFFDEISGLETTQILRYSARCIQLMNDIGGPALEEEFLHRLEKAPSNIADTPNGRLVYERFVKPSTVDLMRVGMHFSVASLFEDYQEQNHIYVFDVESKHFERHAAGRVRMGMGRAIIRSPLTLGESDFSYAVIHLGDHNIYGGIREYMGEDSFNQMKDDMRKAFVRNDLAEIIRVVDRHFEVRNYSFWHLFLDEQRKIMKTVFAESEKSIEAFYRDVYRDNYPLMNAMKMMNMPLPVVLRTTVDFVLNRDLYHCLEEVPPNETRFKEVSEEVKKWDAKIDKDALGFLGGKQMAELTHMLSDNPLDFTVISEIESLLTKYYALNAPLNLWASQNMIHEIGLQEFDIRSHLAEKGDPVARDWVERFTTISNLLGVHIG